MKCNIYLIGFMGTGKSTVAKELCRRLEVKWLEADDKIVQETGMKITEIFERYGEAYFRDLETKLLTDLQGDKKQVVSCGGGMVIRKENVALMKQNGVVVCLTAAPKTIYERVRDSKERPVLNNHMRVSYISDLIDKRREYYEGAADIFVQTDGRSVADICEEIVEKVSDAIGG